MRSMKAMLSAMVVAATVGGAGAARAIDLRNEDGAAHEVTVTSSSMTRQLSVGGLTLSLVICVGECAFELPGVGVVRARGNDVVTLKDGAITVTPAAPRAATR